MKKILLIVPMLHQGGFEKVCVRTARLLQGHCEVYILIFSGDNIAYDIKGLQVIDIHIKTTKSRMGKLWNVWKRIQKVKQAKKELQIDIAYSFGITANLVNVLSRMQETIWIGLRGFTDLSSGLYPFLCRRADKIVCCSQTIEAIVKDRFQKKDVCTLYNPYDIVTMQTQAGEALTKEEQLFFERFRVVVSMGREDEVKGFWHLLRSFASLQRQLPDTGLMIIGEGQYEENKAFAKELGIEDKVMFTGLKKNPFPCLRRAALYALTSLNEGFPNALLEAMALQVPVIAVNCLSGPAEILAEDYRQAAADDRKYYAEYGILLPALQNHKDLTADRIEPEEQILTEEMLYLLENEEMHSRYRKAGLQRAEEFSDSAYLNRILKFMA